MRIIYWYNNTYFWIIYRIKFILILNQNSLYIYKDGTIRYHGSGGATFHTEDLYRLSSNGYDLELINHYEVDWESYSDAVYYDGEKYLTPEEFNKITEELGYISPEWFSFLENR